MKIISIVGARPQFIKSAAVSRAIQKSDVCQEVIVHTGQHYDKNLSDVFYQELDIPKPKYNLGIGSCAHGEQTGRMIIGIEQVLKSESPDWALVYGDTNSTLAGAIAAAKLHIPLAHVEAGLRSFNRHMPEEINRILTDHVSNILFAPTEAAAANLKKEGIEENRVLLVGDVMFDAAVYYAEQAEKKSRILEKLKITAGEYILVTTHRAENTDDSVKLRAILDGLIKVAQKRSVIFPLHPRTRKVLVSNGLIEMAEKYLCVIEPIGYPDMMILEKQALLIATDSGGVQKEAFFWRVPCVTLRNETEWIELVEVGWNTVCPPISGDEVALAIESRLGTMGEDVRLYGHGDASHRIITSLLEHLQ